MTDQQDVSIPGLLVELYRATVAVHQAIRDQGNALGMCWSCTAAWCATGQKMGMRIPPAVVWTPLGVAQQVAVCIPCFETLRTLDSTPRIVPAAPGDVPPQGPGLFVPGH